MPRSTTVHLHQKKALPRNDVNKARQGLTLNITPENKNVATSNKACYAGLL
jgi:hypothetical protein